MSPRDHTPAQTALLAATDGTTRETIVVVGNGMVGHRLVEELVARDAHRDKRIVCIGEEPRPAYDRVHLSELFAGRSADDLGIADKDWYVERGVELRTGERVVAIDRAARTVKTSSGNDFAYDALVLATGSAPFVPPLPGTDLPGVFVYRTIEDVDAIRAFCSGARRAAVIGGGLLGLEAAKAMLDMGLETHVVEFAPRLMPRQVDAGGGEVLRASIERLGVQVHTGVQTEAIETRDGALALRLRGGEEIAVDAVVVSAGIRPRDELARAAGLAVGERGGIVVDTELATSDPRIFCIGESALASGMIYGLVAPGYEMARTLAARLCGEDRRFTGADLSTKLKLLGVAVASFGDAFADESLGRGADRVVFEDRARGVYQKLVVSMDGRRLLGGVLVGDATAYPTLLAATRAGHEIEGSPRDLLLGANGSPGAGAEVRDEDQVCSCNGVSAGEIRCAIRDNELETVAGIKSCTRAGTGCGGCSPVLATLLEHELAAAGRTVNKNLCEHFSYTRQELFEIVKLGRVPSFDALLASHGRGGGCEICRPAIASILATTKNDLILEHATIQDTNDRFLANIQRGGTYSVVPRVPGGEITPEKLIALGEIAKRFDLSCKITGGQRIDLLGARVEQLPDIWEALVDAGFESGHAYGKAMRTVKSCVGSTWCRFGVQDSTALAIRIEERYRGLRSPHKLKSAVSGCIRECAEAQSKDFGVIATEKGWNLYVCGNGGAQPRHADLLAADLDEETLIRFVDRFLMYYIQTANPLERTARWLERLDGGLATLRRVVVEDALGIGAQLERDMQALVDGYQCEWTAVVRDPERRAAFRHFANSAAGDPELRFVRERGQKRPADWAGKPAAPALPFATGDEARWVRVAAAADVPRDGGVTVRHGDAQIALFNFATRGAWYACQASCPHKGDMVLGRGLLGTQGNEPKVACPLHKKTFSLETGLGLSDPQLALRTFPVEVRDGEVYLGLPSAEELAGAACGAHAACRDAAEGEEVRP
jgi:NAD(P)H-dependent nitrite reductase large subunit/NAD(P)H-dependent nitrite reductase small subunit